MRLPDPQSLVLLALALSLPLACGGGETAASGKTLVFTAIPNQNTTELTAKFQPIAAFLQAELGVPVRYEAVTDYAASVEAFKSGDVQLAWFGGYTGAQAREAVEGARALVAGKADMDYHSYFIANEDAGIETSDDFPLDLEGKTFTFGSKSSTSGRLMPEYYIRKHTGKAPADFLAGDQMSFSGAHDATAKAVEAGTFDAGAIDYKVYDRMVAEGSLDPKRCRIIWTTPAYPDYQFTAHPELEVLFGAGFTDKLEAALLRMEAPELLRALDRPEGLTKATNEDFAPLLETAKEIGLMR